MFGIPTSVEKRTSRNGREELNMWSGACWGLKRCRFLPPRHADRNRIEAAAKHQGTTPFSTGLSAPWPMSELNLPRASQGDANDTGKTYITQVQRFSQQTRLLSLSTRTLALLQDALRMGSPTTYHPFSVRCSGRSDLCAGVPELPQNLARMENYLSRLPLPLPRQSTTWYNAPSGSQRELLGLLLRKGSAGSPIAACLSCYEERWQNQRAAGADVTTMRRSAGSFAHRLASSPVKLWTRAEHGGSPGSVLASFFIFRLEHLGFAPL